MQYLASWLPKLLLALVAALMAALWAGAAAAADWRTASRESMGLAPDPAQVQEAVVQVYGARVVGARGIFGVHTWVAVKPTAAPAWTVYEVIGWRLRYGDSAVVIREGTPDARWFGSDAVLYADKRGPGVDDLIRRVDAAARSYPYAGKYTLWPGPNSNTFTAWISRAVPELELDLPATAIGKDYTGGQVFGAAPSGHGFQFSLAGLLGLLLSPVEGVEVNLLGLSFGVSPLGIKLPFVGRIGGFQAPSRTVAELPAAPLSAEGTPQDKAL
jgi:hypothetical protein